MKVVTYDVEGWGVGVLHYDEGVLIAHDEPGTGRDVAPVTARETDVEVLISRLRAWYAGEPDSFSDIDCEPAIVWAGLTDYEAAVVRAVRTIPRGETASYGEIATLAGRHRAWRAAGATCGRGVMSAIVPYHRVIRSNGDIGGYGMLGQQRKQRLLALEGVHAR